MKTLVVVFPCGAKKNDPNALDAHSHAAIESAAQFYRSEKPEGEIELAIMDYQVRHPEGGPTLSELCQKKAVELDVPLRLLSRETYTAVMDAAALADVAQKENAQIKAYVYASCFVPYFRALCVGTNAFVRPFTYVIVPPDVGLPVPLKGRLVYWVLGKAARLVSKSFLGYSLFQAVMIRLNRGRLTKGFYSTL